MKRGFLVAVGGAAIVVGLAGCGGDEKSADTGTATGTGSAGASQAKVTIDGQDQSVKGTVVCQTMGDTVNIAVGDTAAGGFSAQLTTADPPQVKTVALGTFNGVALAVGMGQGKAEATKDGNTYKITGTATGIDTANPLQPANKPFEMNVTCP